MSDLIKRLRNYRIGDYQVAEPLDECIEAADEIERLRAQNAKLREALQWYVANDNANEGGDWDRVSAFWREGRTRAIALLTAPMNGEK